MGNSPEYAGTIGLAFVSTLDDWKDRPIYTLQLVNGEGLLAISAYTMELLGILIALSILAHFQMTTKISSDCEAAVKSVNNLRESRKVIRAKARDASLLTMAAKLLGSQNTEVAWIKGHPEKSHPDADEWTKDMWGNHLADRTAAGIFFGQVEYQYQNLYSNLLSITALPTLDVKELSSRLAPMNFWYFGTGEGQLVSTSITEAVQKNRATRYLQKRDGFRAERELPLQWQAYDLTLTATIWQMKKNVLTRTLRNRLIFDKHWHSGNRAKSNTTQSLQAQLEKCPFCPNPDSAAHWIVHCEENTRAVALRQELVRSIRAYSTNLYSENKEYQHTIFAVTEEYLGFLDKCPEVWRGLWTQSQLDSFRIGPFEQQYTDHKRNFLRKHFLTLGKMTTDTTMLIWQSRQLTVLELSEYMIEHPDIRYSPPEHVFYPNVKHITLSTPQLTTLAHAAVQPPYVPPVRFSLSKTKRKLHLPAPAVEEVVPLVAKTWVLPQAAEVVHRKRKSGAMALTHLFNHRKAQQNKIHWRRQRRAPIPLDSTPSIMNYLPGNPDNIVPVRMPVPPVTVPSPKHIKTTITTDYKLSLLGHYFDITTYSRKEEVPKAPPPLPPSKNSKTIHHDTEPEDTMQADGFQDAVRIFNPG
jgi:ribonuclease HI